MLRINRQTDYAVRVILALAKHGEGVKLSTGEIQREMLIPPAFMSRIVAQLAKTDLLNTFPGRDGGLILARPAAQITLKDVLEVFEGPILLPACMQAKGEDDCPFQANCPVRTKWGRVQAVMFQELESITFDELVSDSLDVPLMTPNLVS
jgi:Rrf2 family protein